MNQPSLKALALRIALFVALLVGVVVFFATYKQTFSQSVFTSAASFLLIGIFIYFLFLHYVRNYINAPIRSLYKAIYNVKVEDGEKSDIPMGDEPMQQIQKEVSVWMKNRSNE